MTENEISFQGKKYISSNRASEISGYAKDYVGQLCRSGEIKCQRVGRGWFINADDLLFHIKKSPRRNYKKLNKEIVQISSKKALFISLLYSFSFKRYKQFILPVSGLVLIIAMVIGLSVYGRSIEEFILITTSKINQTLSSEIYAIYKDPTRIGDLLNGAINAIGDSFTSFSISVSNETIVFVNKTSQDPFYISHLIDRTLFSLSVSAKNNLAVPYFDLISKLMTDTARNTFKNIREVKKGFVMLPQNLKEIVMDFFNLHKEKTIVVKEKDFKEPKVRDGLVVIPDAKDEDRIKTIKGSFSDEIIVKPDDEVGDSGIIQPVFRKGKGEEYIYVMVPAKEQKVEEKKQ